MIDDRSLKDVQRLRKESLLSLLSKLDLLLPGHGYRIQDNARIMLNAFPGEVDVSDVNKLFLLCNLHDVGKLVKGHRLAGLDRHSALGGEIAWSHPELNSISELIYYHHERWDGNGFYGLEGENIPYYCRLVKILDSFDNLVYGRRTGQKLMSKQEAIKRLEQGSGSQFDPQIMPLAIEVLG